ncbi:hypothetical protein CBA19CS22_18025 [Caballeronia novacaledonica]|uniref:Uncharacterized protein n=1 Tax=Caballeronia novacaledonica TaxID=1544861 RepID=A0ACB5QUS2_9BURK|nr:hypothetical protein CBA19CS22_18025 [Caballeronia novacaledonica]
MSTIAQELRELFTKINIYVGRELLSFDTLTDAKSLDPVQSSVCLLIRGIIESGIKSERDLTAISIPWAYHSPTHHDYDSFVKRVREDGLPNVFVPLSIFAYRGICYSGFANGLSQRTDLPAVYVASPGRMNVLAQLLDARDVASLRYPLVAYRDLVSILRLPNNGYVFDHIRALPASQLSELTREVATKTPRDSLKFVLGLRNSSEGITLRKQWAERIWARGLSASTGSEAAISVKDSNIGGSLTQIQIFGAALD